VEVNPNCFTRSNWVAAEAGMAESRVAKPAPIEQTEIAQVDLVIVFII
jgi:hypothetical protein